MKRLKERYPVQMILQMKLTSKKMSAKSSRSSPFFPPESFQMEEVFTWSFVQES